MVDAKKIKILLIVLKGVLVSFMTKSSYVLLLRMANLL